MLDDGGLRRHDAVAVEGSECLVLGRDTLLYFLERNPPLLRRVAANMLRSLLDLLEMLRLPNVRDDAQFDSAPPRKIACANLRRRRRRSSTAEQLFCKQVGCL